MNTKTAALPEGTPDNMLELFILRTALRDMVAVLGKEPTGDSIQDLGEIAAELDGVKR
jgi:hypothetical protein